MKKKLLLMLIVIARVNSTNRLFRNNLKLLTNAVRFLHTHNYTDGRPRAENNADATLWIISNLENLTKEDLEYVKNVAEFSPQVPIVVASIAARLSLRESAIAQWSALVSYRARQIWYKDIIKDQEIAKTDLTVKNVIDQILSKNNDYDSKI